MSGLARDARVFVAGHLGLVGSAIVRHLQKHAFSDIVVRSHQELDLTDPRAVDSFFEHERPQHVFLAAAKVGGILANATYPGDFIRENLAIQLNVLDAARRYGVERLLFLGSSCVYPRDAPQPISESSFLSGPLEPTNEAYAIAKIVGVKTCQAYWRQYGCHFVSVMPTNLYGPRDNFDLQSSHVLPALLRKFHEAKTAGAQDVSVWGSGRPRREFLHVDDLAEACLVVLERWHSPEIVNIGVGKDVSIAELARLIRDIVGFAGGISFDDSKPDGTPQKLLDVSRMRSLGWEAKIDLAEGIRNTYAWYRDHLGT